MRTNTVTLTPTVMLTRMSIERTSLAETFRDPVWRRGLLRNSFGGDFWGFVAFAVAAGAAVWIVKGQAAFLAAARDDAELLLSTVPRILAALSIAGLLWAMLPRDRLGRLIGRESNWRGLFVAAAAGTVTPGGPASAFPLLALLGGAGADRGALVAYIVAWSTMGLQRILVWDVPFMGAEFSATRFLLSIPLPIIAGLIARRLPIELALRDAEAGPEERVRT